MQGNRSDKNKSALKDRAATVIIVILAIILVLGASALSAKVLKKSSRSYEANKATYLISDIKYGNYDSLIYSVGQNRGLGVTEEDNGDYTVPYAAADYIEAAMDLKVCEGRGYEEKAAQLRKQMEEYKEKMGDLAFVTDDIDEMLGLETE